MWIWGPTWRHVGHFFLQKGAAATDANLYFLGSMFFFGFLAILTPSWRHLGSIWEGLGLDFGRFLGSILKAFGDNFGLRLLLENLRLPLENLNLQFRLLLQNLVFRSILLASGSGWAGGVTRSAKNLYLLRIVSDNNK